MKFEVLIPRNGYISEYFAECACKVLYRPSENLLMLQRRKGSDERDSERRHQAVDGEA